MLPGINTSQCKAANFFDSSLPFLSCIRLRNGVHMLDLPVCNMHVRTRAAPHVRVMRHAYRPLACNPEDPTTNTLGQQA